MVRDNSTRKLRNSKMPERLTDVAERGLLIILDTPKADPAQAQLPATK